MFEVFLACDSLVACLNSLKGKWVVDKRPYPHGCNKLRSAVYWIVYENMENWKYQWAQPLGVCLQSGPNFKKYVADPISYGFLPRDANETLFTVMHFCTAVLQCMHGFRKFVYGAYIYICHIGNTEPCLMYVFTIYSCIINMNVYLIQSTCIHHCTYLPGFNLPIKNGFLGEIVLWLNKKRKSES